MKKCEKMRILNVRSNDSWPYISRHFFLRYTLLELLSLNSLGFLHHGET